MKRIIYTPAIGEPIPDNADARPYIQPVSGIHVIDLIVPDDFTTAGTVYHDSSTGLTLTEPYIHHHAGWEVFE